MCACERMGVKANVNGGQKNNNNNANKQMRIYMERSEGQKQIGQKQT